ncbi:MAG TPA: serine hydrolase domain-containing protein [Arenimonas sp.]
MTRTYCLVLAVILTATGCTHRDPATLESMPEDVRQSVDAAIENGHRVGVVVGMVTPRGRFFHASGVVEAGGDTPMAPDTVVGIGSLTKLFTAELLADAVVEGRLELDTPVAQLLPVQDAADTRLWQLATHRAGLPRRLPAAALQSDAPDLLYATLAEPRSLPAEPAYSNVGYALLGEALAASGETMLASLVERRLGEPMELGATSYAPDPARLASPHQGSTPVSTPRIPEFARGAGGLYSTAEDLLTFAAWHLSPAEEGGKSRVALLTGTGLPGEADALGWKRHREGDLDVFHHGGDGNGYQAFVAFRPANGTAVALVTNSSADDELQQVAYHLLDPTVPLPAFEDAPALLLTAEQLKPYAGLYRIRGDTNTIELTATDDGLVYAERDEDGGLVRRSRLFAVAPDTFELREIRATLRFSGNQPATLSVGEQVFVLDRQ